MIAFRFDRTTSRQTRASEILRGVASRFGIAAAAARLAADEELRAELAATMESLQEAWSRVERKRSHRLRSTLIVVSGAAGAVAVFKFRSKLPVGGSSEEIKPSPVVETPVERPDEVPAAAAEPQ